MFDELVTAICAPRLCPKAMAVLGSEPQLEFGLAIVKSVRAVIDTEILQREFAFAIVKRATAAKTGQWLIMRRRGFDPNDFVFCSAVGAMEACRVCHAELIASGSGVYREKFLLNLA